MQLIFWIIVLNISVNSNIYSEITLSCRVWVIFVIACDIHCAIFKTKNQEINSRWERIIFEIHYAIFKTIIQKISCFIKKSVYTFWISLWIQTEIQKKIMILTRRATS